MASMIATNAQLEALLQTLEPSVAEAEFLLLEAVQPDQAQQLNDLLCNAQEMLETGVNPLSVQREINRLETLLAAAEDKLEAYRDQPYRMPERSLEALLSEYGVEWAEDSEILHDEMPAAIILATANTRDEQVVVDALNEAQARRKCAIWMREMLRDDRVPRGCLMRARKWLASHDGLQQLWPHDVTSPTVRDSFPSFQFFAGDAA